MSYLIEYIQVVSEDIHTIKDSFNVFLIILSAHPVKEPDQLECILRLS